MIPSSVMTAVASSAAAGKNPWLPFGVLFLLAGFESVPEFLIDPDLHAGLHGMAEPTTYFVLAGVFLTLTALESFADKISWIESWLTPLSAAWRPIAAVAISAFIGAGAAVTFEDVPAAAPEPTVAAALRIDWTESGFWFAVTVLSGTVFGLLATIGKVGTRLLLSLVPLPSLRLLHSFLDDFFAIGVTLAGLIFDDSGIAVVAALVYLLVGAVTGPALARLALIHVRVGLATFRKARRMVSDEPPPPLAPPGWLLAMMTERGIDPQKAGVVAAYAYRAPDVGWCRAGYLVLSPAGALFAARSLFGKKLYAVTGDALSRLGLAETVTAREVTLVERTGPLPGDLREVRLDLFPLEDEAIQAALDLGLSGYARVKPRSESARRGLAGYAGRGATGRYVAREHAGGLRSQAVLTLAAAIGVGLFTGGAFIPIGAGYLVSPFKRRFLFGLAVSGYLALCIVSTLGLAWPAAVIYATLLNAIALRDHSRQGLRAAVDGFVDRRAFLPPVSGRVWVPRSAATPQDYWAPTDSDPVSDAPWRVVVEELARWDAAEVRATAG